MTRCSTCHRPAMERLCSCTASSCWICAWPVTEPRAAGGLEGASRYYCRKCRWEGKAPVVRP